MILFVYSFFPYTFYIIDYIIKKGWQRNDIKEENIKENKQYETFQQFVDTFTLMSFLA